MTMTQVEIECRLWWLIAETVWRLKEKARLAFALPERDEDDPRERWCGLLS